MRKRSIEGPGWCTLCKGANENSMHLFILCPFSKQVWQDITLHLNQRLTWEGPSIETTWQQWTQHTSYKNIKAFPFIICWGIWLARNKEIFQDQPSLPELTASQGLAILSHFPQEKDIPPIHPTFPTPIDLSKPWAYFDDASQTNNQICGGGATLYLSNKHLFKIKMGLGPGTNNYVELLALKLLLQFVGEKGVQNLQIFGDSKNVINWTRKQQSCHNIFLQPLLEEIFRLLDALDSYSLKHVYRE
jgi:hypothetical protein